MEYRNINGFNVQIVELEDYLKNLDDGEILKVMRVGGTLCFIDLKMTKSTTWAS